MWCRTTIVAATFAISSSGMAAELAKSGSIEGQVYIHTVQKIDELDAPDGMKAYINELFEFHVPKQRGELLDGMSGRCLAYGKYSDAGAFKESGRCSKVDADGDKIFEEYEAEATGPNDTTQLKSNLTAAQGNTRVSRPLLPLHSSPCLHLARQTRWAPQPTRANTRLATELVRDRSINRTAKRPG